MSVNAALRDDYKVAIEVAIQISLNFLDSGSCRFSFRLIRPVTDSRGLPGMPLPALRTKIVRGLVENYGVTVAEISPSGNLDLRGFEDPKKNFVQLSQERKPIELPWFLQVKELSTASHAVRRAKERLKEDSGFRRQADQALKRLHSSMQAYCPCPDRVASQTEMRNDQQQVYTEVTGSVSKVD